MVAPDLRGHLLVFVTSSNPLELEKFPERFPVGAAVSCRVKAVDTENGTLDFTLGDARNSRRSLNLMFHLWNGRTRQIRRMIFKSLGS